MKNYEKIYTNIKQSICLHTRQGQEDRYRCCVAYEAKVAQQHPDQNDTGKHFQVIENSSIEGTMLTSKPCTHWK